LHTPIGQAVVVGDVVMIQLLIDQGADVNVINSKGRNPLFNAVQWNDYEVVVCLLENKAEVNVLIKGFIHSVTALDEAGGRIYKLLREYRALTYREVAKQSEKVQKLNELLEKGKIKAIDKRLSTDVIYLNAALQDKVLELAIDKERIPVIEKILNNFNLSVDEDIGEQGQSLLIRAVILESPKVIAYLLSKGANKLLLDKAGKSAIDYATSKKVKKLLGVI
jgi:ankyrin repeat protein